MVRKKSWDAEKNQRDVLQEMQVMATKAMNADSNLTLNGKIKISIYEYGDTHWLTPVNVLALIEVQGGLENIEFARGEKDIPFENLGLATLDFAGLLEDEDGYPPSDEDMAIIYPKLEKKLLEYGFEIHHTDSEYFFGRYLPWYVGGKMPKEFDYGLDDITDLHPYSVMKGDTNHSCSDNADLEIYEDDFIVMECNVCGRTATFRQEGPFEGPRRNPLTEPAHSFGAAVTSGIVGAFIGALIEREKTRRKGE
jgi:hypothetical protein